MSVSLYYTARRAVPITLQEQNNCDEIVKRYDEQYPFGELYEGFCIYDQEPCREGNEESVILDGATKLPSDVSPELCLDIADWWLACLAELKCVLVDAQWHVHLDDMDFEWCEEKHCFLPDMVI